MASPSWLLTSQRAAGPLAKGSRARFCCFHTQSAAPCAADLPAMLRQVKARMANTVLVSRERGSLTGLAVVE